MMKNELTESLEKYLISIYEIVKVNRAARVKDVSNYMQIGGPSTSEAVKTLARRGFINYVPYGIITITEKGIKRAEEKLNRQKIISKFLGNVLKVEDDKINESTAQIEYSMSPEVLKKFVSFLSFTETCSCKTPKWIKSYHYYAEYGEIPEKCLACTSLNKNCHCEGCCNNL